MIVSLNLSHGQFSLNQVENPNKPKEKEPVSQDFSLSEDFQKHRRASMFTLSDWNSESELETTESESETTGSDTEPEEVTLFSGALVKKEIKWRNTNAKENQLLLEIGLKILQDPQSSINQFTQFSREIKKLSLSELSSLKIKNRIQVALRTHSHKYSVESPCAYPEICQLINKIREFPLFSKKWSIEICTKRREKNRLRSRKINKTLSLLKKQKSNDSQNTGSDTVIEKTALSSGTHVKEEDNSQTLPPLKKQKLEAPQVSSSFLKTF